MKKLKAIVTDDAIKFVLNLWKLEKDPRGNMSIEEFMNTPELWPPEYTEDDRMISLDEAKTLAENTVVEASKNSEDWNKRLFKFTVDSITRPFCASEYMHSIGGDVYPFIRWPEGPKMQAKLVPLEDEQQ